MTKRQIEYTKIALKAIADMSEESLKKQRDMIATSIGYNKEIKDILIEGIDSRLNRNLLRNIAIVPEPELTLGET